MLIFRGLRFKPDEEVGLFSIFEMASNVNHTYLCSYMAFSHHDFIRQFKTKNTWFLLGFTIRDPLDRERLSSGEDC